MHIDLKSGNWIEIVPVSGLKAKHKDAFEGAPKLFITLDDQGNPDLSKMPLSMTIAIVQRHALLASILSGWSFTQDDGSPLPVPRWTRDDAVSSLDAFGEIPLDDWNEIEDLLKPYLAKVQRQPDPKETTTGSSTGT